MEGLLGPKQRPWSLLLHFALEPTPSGSEEEGEEAGLTFPGEWEEGDTAHSEQLEERGEKK